jgi:hypothetical protein
MSKEKGLILYFVFSYIVYYLLAKLLTLGDTTYLEPALLAAMWLFAPITWWFLFWFNIAQYIIIPIIQMLAQLF